MQLSVYRKKLGLTLEEVAEQVGSSINSVSRHERGIRRPPPHMIERYRRFSEGLVTAEDWQKLALAKDEVAACDTESKEQVNAR